MSDETECRVSYRDAKQIAKEVGKPYERALNWCMAILIVVLIALALSEIINWISPPEMSKGLMHLVDTGQITEETARYLFDESGKTAKFSAIIAVMCSFLIPFMALASLKNDAVKKALKEENERRSKE